ncbi:hypothetical protein K7432_016005, partial [Basidiobolus ranarum]
STVPSSPISFKRRRVKDETINSSKQMKRSSKNFGLILELASATPWDKCDITIDYQDCHFSTSHRFKLKRFHRATVNIQDNQGLG